MLFCDRCDRGYHTFCVGLKNLPRGRWMCKSCRRDRREEDPNKPCVFIHRTALLFFPSSSSLVCHSSAVCFLSLSVPLSYISFSHMYFCLSVCLSVCLYVCLSVCTLPLSLPISLSFSLSLSLSLSLFLPQSRSPLSLPNTLSLLPLFLFPPISLSVCLSLSLLCLSLLHPISPTGMRTSLNSTYTTSFVSVARNSVSPLSFPLPGANTR